MEQKEKYLFLDIDGVLNHEEWYEETHKNPQPFPISCFDPQCVRRVNEILDASNAKLVISSSWRIDNELTKTLFKVGLQHDFDVTPVWKDNEFTDYSCRGAEIKAFLDKHPYSTYCIVDDDNDMLREQIPYFVQTTAGITMRSLYKENGGTGLTEKVKEKIILILNQ